MEEPEGQSQQRGAARAEQPAGVAVPGVARLAGVGLVSGGCSSPRHATPSGGGSGVGGVARSGVRCVRRGQAQRAAAR
jgi:hypothetical protein